MFGQSEIAQFNVEIFVNKHVMRFDISMHNSMLMQIGNHPHHLLHNHPPAILIQIGLLLMDYVEEGALLDQLHCQTQLRGFGYGADHEDDVGVPVFGQHVDFVVELFEELLADVGVEYLLYCYVEVEVFAFVDCAETAH